MFILYCNSTAVTKSMMMMMMSRFVFKDREFAVSNCCCVSSVYFSGNGIYSQKSAEISRSSEEHQLSAGRSLGHQDHGLWT